MLQEATSVAMGILVGLVVIWVLNVFPGEPFDYETDRNPLQEEAAGGAGEKKHELQPNYQSHEATQLHEATLHATEDCLCCAGNFKQQQEHPELQQQQQQPTKTPNVARKTLKPSDFSVRTHSSRLNLVVYTILFLALTFVMKREYDISILEVACYFFPRECDTLRRVAAMPKQLLDKTFALST